MQNRIHRRRSARQGGSEAIEFTFVMAPLFCMIFVLLNIAWAVFAESTLQRAVRIGVRYGIAVTTLPQGSTLTDSVKSTVQANSLGLLNGSSGLNYIKVHYFLPPASNSTSPPTDISTASNADAGGNIMQVSVQGFTLVPFVPRIYSYSQNDTSPFIVNVYAADEIEPSRTPPPVGTAP